jgi:hypothetical protein
VKLDKAQVLDEQPISIDVLLEKYAKGESRRSTKCAAVARGLAQVERAEVRELWEKRFYDAMVDGYSAAASTRPRAPALRPR